MEVWKNKPQDPQACFLSLSAKRAPAWCFVARGIVRDLHAPLHSQIHFFRGPFLGFFFDMQNTGRGYKWDLDAFQQLKRTLEIGHC